MSDVFNCIIDMIFRCMMYVKMCIDCLNWNSARIKTMLYVFDVVIIVMLPRRKLTC